MNYFFARIPFWLQRQTIVYDEWAQWQYVEFHAAHQAARESGNFRR
jgi:hypothetical protein